MLASPRPAREEAAMKILIGVDDSPHSTAALEFVKRMTWPQGSEVVVVSAVRPSVALYTEAYAPPAEVVEGVIEEQRKRHEDLVSRAEVQLRDRGFKTSTRVLIGDPREALIEMAKGEAADLIVLGSHGRSGLTKLLMGSVASHVVTHAPCSVLVVRTGTKTN
jgi:nucleotide-binding universal stress UspA family protein